MPLIFLKRAKHKINNLKIGFWQQRKSESLQIFFMATLHKCALIRGLYQGGVGWGPGTDCRMIGIQSAW